MKNILKLLFAISVLFGVCSCEGYLDPNQYSVLTKEDIYGNGSFYIKHIPGSLYSIISQRAATDYMTAAADEAEYIKSDHKSQKFNNGGWNKYSNPDDEWKTLYKGVRIACDYLEESKDIIFEDWRYTNPALYRELIRNLCIGRGEVRLLRAYFYFELMKRYGEVPLITSKISISDGMDLVPYKRAPISDIVDFICEEVDIVTREGKYFLTSEKVAQMTNNGRNVLPVPYRDTLVLFYPESGVLSEFLGRATTATAYALKAKTLVYYASKQFNADNDITRWQDAAKACKKVLDLPKIYYNLSDSYSGIFSAKKNWNKEFLFVRRDGAANSFERENFPISLEGGSTGFCPSQNQVDAYEVKVDATTSVPFDWNNPTHASNPYANRDPRLAMSVYRHGEQYSSVAPNNITLDCSEGGNSGAPKLYASSTGYYMKKYIDPTLDLKNNKTESHTWVAMRMADFYLYYAEAMNEAYGPTAQADLGMSATEAINRVRARPDVNMPPIRSADQDIFREKVYNERRVELAFENHRWWDLRRWQRGQNLNEPLRGIKITKNGPSTTYEPIEVEKRVFDESKMYLYPIPQNEIDRSKNVLVQNPNW